MNAMPERSWGPAAYYDGTWAAPHERDVVRDALFECATRLSTMREDWDGSDYVIEMPKTNMGVRIRRMSSIPGRTPTDVTIRSKRKSGARTELAKLHDRKIGLYTVAWIGDIGFKDVLEWVCYDVLVAMDAGLFRDRKDIWNKDGGSAFIAVPISELEECGALVARRKFGIVGSFAEVQEKWAQYHIATGCDCSRDKWQDSIIPNRYGWIRTVCECGRFIGYRTN